jgi:hypothetical protein
MFYNLHVEITSKMISCRSQPAPGVPAALADDKHKDKDSGGHNGGFPVPGLPAPRQADDSSNGGYDNGNIKQFDTSKSSFRIGGSNSKVVEFRPGFNETFYNSTLPYCFAVPSGSCYNTATGQIIP